MKAEYRVTIVELAKIIGVSAYTLRTWISSYKFAKYLKYDDFFKKRQKLNILLNESFCREFIPYLANKDLKNKGYVKNFCENIKSINLNFI